MSDSTALHCKAWFTIGAVHLSGNNRHEADQKHIVNKLPRDKIGMSAANRSLPMKFDQSNFSLIC